LLDLINIVQILLHDFQDYVYQTKTQTSICKLLVYVTIISHAPSAH